MALSKNQGMNFNFASIRIFSKLCASQKQLNAMNDGIAHWEAIIQALLNAIDSLTPPEAFLDPPYLNHHERIYGNTKESALNLYCSALQKFLQLTV